MTDPGRLGIWSALDGLRADEAAAFAKRVEQLGYGALWLPEALGRDPFAVLGHLAAHTTSIVLGTGIASIYARNAAAMKAAANGVGELSGNRFVLGLGVSHGPMVENVLHEKYDRPYTRMSEYLDSYGTAPYMGPAAEVPVLLAALRRRMLELSRDKADGAFPYLVPPEHIAGARQILGPGKRIVVTVPVALTDDTAAARETGRAYLAVYLNLPNYMNNLRELGFGDDDRARPGSDRLVDAVVAHGSVEAVRRRIAEYQDAGADHTCVIPLRPNGFMPQSETVEALAP